MELNVKLTERQRVEEEHIINGEIEVKVHFFMDEFVDFGIIANRYDATNDDKKKLQIYDKVEKLVSKMLTVDDKYDLSLTNKIEIINAIGQQVVDAQKK